MGNKFKSEKQMEREEIKRKDKSRKSDRQEKRETKSTRFGEVKGSREANDHSDWEY